MSLRSMLVLRLMQKKLNFNKPLETLRKEFAELSERGRKKSNTSITREIIDGVPCMWIIPEGCSTGKLKILNYGALEPIILTI